MKKIKYVLSGSAIRINDEVSVGYEQKIMAINIQDAIRRAKRFISEVCNFFKMNKPDFNLNRHGKSVWENKT